MFYGVQYNALRKDIKQLFDYITAVHPPKKKELQDIAHAFYTRAWQAEKRRQKIHEI